MLIASINYDSNCSMSPKVVTDINDESFDLLFHTHFIFLNPKHDSRYNLEQKLVTMSASLRTQTG